MKSSDWALIIALSILWGGAFFFIEIALRAFPPNTLVLLRMGLAMPPLLLVLKFTGQKLPRNFASWRSLTVLGMLNVVLPFVLFIWGQTQISSSLASVLNATTPLWGVVTAHFLTKDEKATPVRVVGVLLGLAGIATMVGPDAFNSGATVLPQIACLIGTLCFALASIYGLRFGKGGMPPMVIATGQVITATIIMLPIALITDAPWRLPMPGRDVIAATVALAVFSTSLAYALYFRLLQSAGASNSLLITFLIPVTAILLGTVFLGEHMAPIQFAGMGLIALGLLVLDGRASAIYRRLSN
jgi:drug/metabolite transporter (DMT)-like permease